MNQETYGFLNIYYGTTSGNSKRMAEDFKDQARAKGFLPILCNLGDFSPERFLSHRLTVLFLSTYGTGGPTEDAERFLQWLRSLSKEGKPLQQMGFVIFGLGNSTFQFFCGMSKKTKCLLQELGAREILPTYFSDAKESEPYESYSKWKNEIISQIVSNLNLTKIQLSVQELKNLTKKFNIKLIPAQIQKWDEKDYEHLNLNFEIKKYLKAEKAQVLQIRQIRKSSEGRSTLYVRIKTNSTNLSPACNIEIYPQNVIDENMYKGSIEFQSENILPYPPLPVKKLMKIMNCSSKPAKTFVQEALFMCKTPQAASRYQALLDQPELWQNSDLTSQDIIKELDLGLQHQASLGINLPRVYTLAGWKPGQIELIVSLFIVKGKMGLTSKFLQSRPKQLKIKVLSSSFFIPEDPETPLIMIANGSGIAPFRSILHYYLNKQNTTKVRPLFLYYGCQKLQEDYYFRQQWQLAQKKGLINLNIATSREGEKLYVQNLLKKDMQKLKRWMFEQKATFFICGSLSMDKDINNLFIEGFKLNGCKPYQALSKVKELQRQKRIVKEVYG